MKKFGYILLAVIGTVSCQSLSSMERHEFTLVDHENKKLYIKDVPPGRLLYEVWCAGTFEEEMEVSLLDTSVFNQMAKK